MMKGRRLPNREKGAVAVIFAVLLAMGVVTGMLALTVDVGSIMVERRQLQNGADATSMALAQECAKKTPKCVDSLTTRTDLENLAGLNATSGLRQFSDGMSQLYPRTDANATNGICGRGTPLVLCASASSNADIANLGNCPPLPSWVASKSLPYVETYVQTKSTMTKDTILPKFFSQALAGGPGPSTTVSACARATWGPPGVSTLTLPLVFGQCNWNLVTANGTKFAPSPPYTPGPNATTPVPNPDVTGDGVGDIWPYITQIFGHVNGSETKILADKFPCGQDLNAQSGQYSPGGFGWVDPCGSMKDPKPDACLTAPTACNAAFFPNGTLGTDPGGNIPKDCQDLIKNFVGTEVDVPIITSVSGSGNTAVFTVDGVSSFFLAGYSQVSNAKPSSLNAYLDNNSAYASKTCINVDEGKGKTYKSTCLWGWFTSPVRPIGTISPSGDPRGPLVIQPAG